MSFSADIEREFSRIRTAIVDEKPRAVDKSIKGDLVPEMRRYGPSPDRAVHVYATGETKESYAAKRKGRRNWLVNTREHSEGINVGTDFGGRPRRARSFRIRRVVTSYMQRGFERVKLEMEVRVADLLERAIQRRIG